MPEMQLTLNTRVCILFVFGISRISRKHRNGAMGCMATLKELRIKARLSAEALGRLANVDGKTVTRAENSLPVQELKAIAIVEALGQALGQDLKIEDIEGLTIY